MNDLCHKRILGWVQERLGAREVTRVAGIQALWGGYGEIFRVELAGGQVPTAIVKYVDVSSIAPPGDAPGLRSHRRKLRSYDVEQYWYEHLARRCPPTSRVARCDGILTGSGSWIFLLEDLDRAGFPGRSRSLPVQEAERCLSWLASFHATFLGTGPAGLWETGTYWHLSTRPDELERMNDPLLRKAAGEVDRRLEACRFRTLVHGDAKPSNFCFGPAVPGVAAVDFQYTGGGCGMKDVAYLLSCMTSDDCTRDADRLVDVYFHLLRGFLETADPGQDAAALEAEWRTLYPLAWTDLLRFLDGWAPGVSPLEDYDRRQIALAMETLKGK